MTTGVGAEEDRSIGSLTLWQRLYEAPDDLLWRIFIDRYEAKIYAWTRKLLRDPNDCDDVYMEVCKKICEIITNDSRKKLLPKDNSYQPILRTICTNVSKDLLSRKGKFARDAVSMEDAAEELFWSLNDAGDLENSLDDEQVARLSRFRASYRRALIGRKAQPQFNPRTAEIFFKIYRDELSTAEVNRQYGYDDRDTARKQAQRELRRIVKLMGLPDAPEERDSSERIVISLAKYHGDLSDAPE